MKYVATKVRAIGFTSTCVCLLSFVFTGQRTSTFLHSKQKIVTMAPTKTLLSVALIASASAFAPAGKAFGRTSTRVYENFGFDFAEDQSENTPDIILGEANYKQWVSTVNDNSFLNRQVSFRKTLFLLLGLEYVVQN